METSRFEKQIEQTSLVWKYHVTNTKKEKNFPHEETSRDNDQKSKYERI